MHHLIGIIGRYFSRIWVRSSNGKWNFRELLCVHLVGNWSIALKFDWLFGGTAAELSVKFRNDHYNMIYIHAV